MPLRPMRKLRPETVQCLRTHSESVAEPWSRTSPRQAAGAWAQRQPQFPAVGGRGLGWPTLQCPFCRW